MLVELVVEVAFTHNALRQSLLPAFSGFLEPRQSSIARSHLPQTSWTFSSRQTSAGSHRAAVKAV